MNTAGKEKGGAIDCDRNLWWTQQGRKRHSSWLRQELTPEPEEKGSRERISERAGGRSHVARLEGTGAVKGARGVPKWPHASAEYRISTDKNRHREQAERPRSHHATGTRWWRSNGPPIFSHRGQAARAPSPPRLLYRMWGETRDKRQIAHNTLN